MPEDIAQHTPGLVRERQGYLRQPANHGMKLVVMVVRIVSIEQPVAHAVRAVGMDVAMVVHVFVRRIVRSDGSGARVRRRAMRQNDDERRNHQRDHRRQSNQATCDAKNPAVTRYFAHTLPFPVIALSPQGGY